MGWNNSQSSIYHLKTRLHTQIICEELKSKLIIVQMCWHTGAVKHALIEWCSIQLVVCCLGRGGLPCIPRYTNYIAWTHLVTVIWDE